MESKIEIRGVKIGDMFLSGKHILSMVVDFYEIKSMTENKIINYACIAKNISGNSTNKFEVPFTTVIRNKINKTI